MLLLIHILQDQNAKDPYHFIVNSNHKVIIMVSMMLIVAAGCNQTSYEKMVDAINESPRSLDGFVRIIQ